MREDCQIDEKEASSTSFLNGCHVTKDNDTTCSGNVISINQQSQLGLVQGIYWVYNIEEKNNVLAYLYKAYFFMKVLFVDLSKKIVWNSTPRGLDFLYAILAVFGPMEILASRW